MATPTPDRLTQALRAARDAGATRVEVSPDGTVVAEFPGVVHERAGLLPADGTGFAFPDWVVTSSEVEWPPKMTTPYPPSCTSITIPANHDGAVAFFGYHSLSTDGTAD